MFQTVFACAVVLGGIGALLGSRASFALLASTAFTFVLTLAGMPFSPAAWMLADLAAVLFILGPGHGKRELVIVSLYAPGWALYFVDQAIAYPPSVLVSSAQFVLSVPWGKAWRRVRRAELKFDPFRDFDLRVKHG